MPSTKASTSFTTGTDDSFIIFMDPEGVSLCWSESKDYTEGDAAPFVVTDGQSAILLVLFDRGLELVILSSLQGRAGP